MLKNNLLRLLGALLVVISSTASAANLHLTKTTYYAISLPKSIQHMNSEKKAFDEHHTIHTDLFRGKIGRVDTMLSISVLTLKPNPKLNKKKLQQDYLHGMLGGVNRALAAADTSHEFIESEQPINEITLGKRTFYHMQIETLKHHINMYTTVVNNRLYSFSITQRTKDQAALSASLKKVLSAMTSIQFKLNKPS